jgi:hypothetical protein
MTLEIPDPAKFAADIFAALHIEWLCDEGEADLELVIRKYEVNYVPTDRSEWSGCCC